MRGNLAHKRIEKNQGGPWPGNCRCYRFVEIPRAVHTLHEDNPEAVLDALREFLGF